MRKKKLFLSNEVSQNMPIKTSLRFYSQGLQAFKKLFSKCISTFSVFPYNV